MAIPLQFGIADYNQTYAKEYTRRQIFLKQMEATLAWDHFLSLICLAAAVVHPLQSPDGGDADRYSFRRFAGIDLIDSRIPDETTILNFSHLSEEHQMTEPLLEHVHHSLS